MKRKSIAITGSGLAMVTVVVVALVFGFGVFQGSSSAEAQEPNSMEARLAQIIQVLKEADKCSTAETVIDRGMEVLYGGMRPLPSQGVPETEVAHRRIGEAELRFAEALRRYVDKGKCEEQRGRALDLKLFIEEMNEVAEAVGKATIGCGLGNPPKDDPPKDPKKLGDDQKGLPGNMDEPPCDQLKPLLDEQTGHAIEAGFPLKRLLHPSYSVKLRSPFVPPWFGTWEEDVLITEPIEVGSCVVVFKETKGLMLKLHFDRVIVVTDPWVATFGVPRGTNIPIWRLEWVPSQYVKEWNICNKKIINADGTVSTGIENTVSQRVKQDVPLNFFWRFYPKTR